jgi:hypothetical protein
MLRIPHLLDNRLTDGGKVVSLTHQPPSTSQKLLFVRGLSKPLGLVRLEGIGISIKFNYLSGLESTIFRLVA